VLHARCVGYLRPSCALRDAAAYWRVVNRADGFDRECGAFERELRRAEAAWRGRRGVKRGMFYLEAAGVDSVVWEDCGWCVDVPAYPPRLQELVPDVVPLARLSGAVRDVVCVREGDEGGGGEVWEVRNDGCDRFWNAYYLVHVEGDSGVALDTVTGWFYDAEVRKRGDVTEMRLSQASVSRWRRFVTGDDEGKGVRWGAFRLLEGDVWVRQRVDCIRQPGVQIGMWVRQLVERVGMLVSRVWKWLEGVLGSGRREMDEAF